MLSSCTDAASEASDVAPAEAPPLTEEQGKELEKAFVSGKFQDAAVLRDLTHKLELSDNQIQVSTYFD